MNKIEEEKERVSVLVETVLDKRLKASDEDDRIDEATRQKEKSEAIEVFIEELSKSVILSKEEIREQVERTLNRMTRKIENSER